jgi:outer membrane murein-binding lipoprotein Lpp
MTVGRQPQGQREATPTQATNRRAPVTPKGSPAASAGPAHPPAAGKLKALESDVRDLSARVEGLEQAVPTTPEATGGAEGRVAEAGPTCLQDLLPDIKNLADKVGGLERLAAIIENLKQAKP